MTLIYATLNEGFMYCLVNTFSKRMNTMNTLPFYTRTYIRYYHSLFLKKRGLCKSESVHSVHPSEESVHESVHKVFIRVFIIY